MNVALGFLTLVFWGAVVVLILAPKVTRRFSDAQLDRALQFAMRAGAGLISLVLGCLIILAIISAWIGPIVAHLLGS